LKYPENIPLEVLEVAQIYALLDIGLTYSDLKKIPASLADNLVKLHMEIKEKEANELEKSSKRR
jgi:hypothetical protein